MIQYSPSYSSRISSRPYRNTIFPLLRATARRYRLGIHFLKCNLQAKRLMDRAAVQDVWAIRLASVRTCLAQRPAPLQADCQYDVRVQAITPAPTEFRG